MCSHTFGPSELKHRYFPFLAPLVYVVSLAISCHVVHIGYMEQNIVGHMSDAFLKRFLHKTCQTDFVYILVISYMGMPSFRTFHYRH